MKPLNCVLLVDDNEADNFFHQRAIQKSEIKSDVVAMEDPILALESIEKGSITPDLIFLDINMPKIDGWEFLERYQALPKETRDALVIVMLTTSMNPQDMVKAERLPSVSGFLSKPLTPELYSELVRKHFKV